MESRLLLACAVAGLTTLGCGPDGPSEPELGSRLPSLDQDSPDGRPFEATATGNANLSPTDDPCIVINRETATGTATHLGEFAWRDVETVDFCAIPGGVAVVGEFVMAAANGDELTGEFTTTGTFQPNGDLLIAGTYLFTGGTGRFVGATGTASWT